MVTVGYEVPYYVPMDHAGQGMNQTQPNFIGPFCHAGGQGAGFVPGTAGENSYTQRGPTSVVWGGGQDWLGCVGDTCGTDGAGQVLFPFPWQYYAFFVSLFNSSCDMYDLDNPDTACFCAQPTSGVAMNATLAKCFATNIVGQAVTLATNMCNSYWGA